MRLQPGLVMPGGIVPFVSVLSALIPSIELIFTTQTYKLDGVTQASLATAGFTVNGTGVVNGSGYTAVDATDSITGSTTLSGDFAITTEFVEPATTGVLFSITAVENPRVLKLNPATQYGITPDPGSFSGPFAATRLTYARSGGTVRVCFDRGSVQGSTTLSAFGSAAIKIANQTNDSWKAAIKTWVLYKATLTDAQIQAL